MHDPGIALIAGEPSGDALGSAVLQGLRTVAGGDMPPLIGVAGPLMQAEGMKSLFPMEDLSVMGLAEILPRLPLLMRRIRETADAVLSARPRVVVTIDAPDFSFRVAQRVRKADPSIKLVHVVAPTVWAWRPGRAKKIAAFLDHLLVVLPFEPPYFEREGLPTTFMGHPMVARPPGDAGEFRSTHHIDPSERILTVLPGSRSGEVKRLLPVFGEVVTQLLQSNSDMRVVVPTVSTVAEAVRAGVAEWPGQVIVTEGSKAKDGAFAASHAALAASGTVALELGLAEVPTVVAYKVHPLTAEIVRRRITVKYANLVNLLLDRPAVPELIQENCRPDLLFDELSNLMASEEARSAQQRAGAEARSLLDAGGMPGDVAARAVWALHQQSD